MIDVAVGVVFRDDGAVLIGQRLAGKPYEGWWEFPGGKFEAGEDAATALSRELDEELGIRVLESTPWVIREHHYEHADVKLHFRRVVRWEGQVSSREGQAFVWRWPQSIDVGPLLPAALAPIAWLGLPSEYAISDAGSLGVDTFLAALERRLADARPLRLLQLREPALDAAAFDLLFEGACARVGATGARLLVSSRHPSRYWSLAAERTSGGVHYTGRDLLAAVSEKGRGDWPLVGASCHSAVELASAGSLGVDVVVYGPVAATASHPHATPLGWQAFGEAIAATPVPVYALGGMRPGDLVSALRSGAHGIALQRAAWRPEQTPEQERRLQEPG
jgi:8-oxo-dGTP diphosphatase